MTATPHSDLRLMVPADCVSIPRIINHLLTNFSKKTTLLYKPLETYEQYLTLNTIWQNLHSQRSSSPCFEITCPRFALAFLGDFDLFENGVASYMVPSTFLSFMQQIKRIKSVKLLNVTLSSTLLTSDVKATQPLRRTCNPIGSSKASKKTESLTIIDCSIRLADFFSKFTSLTELVIEKATIDQAIIATPSHPLLTLKKLNVKELKVERGPQGDSSSITRNELQMLLFGDQDPG